MSHIVSVAKFNLSYSSLLQKQQQFKQGIFRTFFKRLLLVRNKQMLLFSGDSCKNQMKNNIKKEKKEEKWGEEKEKEKKRKRRRRKKRKEGNKEEKKRERDTLARE